MIQTLESRPRGQTHWSTRGLAQATGLSRMTISRIWHAFGLQPHRTETFKLSPDLLLTPGPITANNIVKRPRPEVGPALNVPSGRSSFPARSPTASLSTIKVDVAPTLPLDADQYKAPLKAVPRVISNHTKACESSRADPIHEI